MPLRELIVPLLEVLGVAQIGRSLPHIAAHHQRPDALRRETTLVQDSANCYRVEAATSGSAVLRFCDQEPQNWL